MLYVAHPVTPASGPEPLADETLRRYRAIAVAGGTAQTGAHLPPARQAAAPDRQHHGEKRDALLAGLGIGTMPQRWIEEDIKAGRLKVISPEYRHQIQVVLAWRRDTMGKGRAGWCGRSPSCLPVRGIKDCLPGSVAQEVPKLRPILDDGLRFGEKKKRTSCGSAQCQERIKPCG